MYTNLKVEQSQIKMEENDNHRDPKHHENQPAQANIGTEDVS